MKSLLKKIKEGPAKLVKVVLTVLISILFIAYPFLVYFGLHYFQPRVIYIALGVMAVLRGGFMFEYINKERIVRLLAPVVLILLLVAVGAYANNQLLLLLLPALISLTLAGTFGWSLFTEQSYIETVARSIEEDVPSRLTDYCARVTFLWVGFFLLNASVIVWLALSFPLEYWTVYSGFLTYCLMGTLGFGEYVYRQWKFRTYPGDSFMTPFFKWLFPPRGDVTPDFMSLEKLMIMGRNSPDVVSRDGEETTSWDNYESDVRGFTATLREFEEDRWLIACDDSYAFWVGLMSIWQSDAVAVLPPNSQPGSIRERLDDVSGVVATRDLDIEGVPVLDPLGSESGEAQLHVLEGNPCVLELYTSGTTGEKKKVPKHMSQLRAEIRTLEETWGGTVGDAEIFSTVSHQHIYGLLFRLLWPVSTNRTFDRYSRLLPEELRSRMTAVDNAVLVTSPAHLKRLVNYDSLEWLRRKLCAVFSSGGRLDYDVAQKAQRRLGCLPYEVLGSTETGGIAWRRQDSSEALWTPMDGVAIQTSERGTLEVQSPYVSPDGETWHDTGDYVTIESDDQFVLGDRADRVVNVAEKKVSLPEVENRAEDHDYIAEAAAVVLQSEQHPNRRKIVALAATLSGQQSTEDPDELKTIIRDHLNPHFEPVTLPRRWRFVDKLPRSPQGKVTVKKLRTLFDGEE